MYKLHLFVNNYPREVDKDTTIKGLTLTSQYLNLKPIWEDTSVGC